MLKHSLLTILAILGILNAQAAYNLTATSVTVQDLTVDKTNYFITVQTTYNGTSAYEVAFDLWPAATSILGSFTQEHAEVGYVGYVSSFVHKTLAGGKPANLWYAPDEKCPIALTITKKDDTHCTLSGSMQVISFSNGQTYTYVIAPFDFEYSAQSVDPVQEDPYRFEPTEPTTITFVGDVVDLRKREDGRINITLNEMANETYDWIDLNLVSDELDWPAGTYTVADTYAAGTLTASRGYLGTQNDDPCYVAIRADKESWGQYTPYYITSGSLNVAYNQEGDTVLVTGILTSHNGTIVNVNVRSYNMLYIPEEQPREPETVELDIDTVLITFQHMQSDSLNNAYLYTFNFFNSNSEFPNVLMDVTLNQPGNLVTGTYSMANDSLYGLALSQNQSDFTEWFFGGMPYVFETGSLTLSQGNKGQWIYDVMITDTIGSQYYFSFAQLPHIVLYPDPNEKEVDDKDIPYQDELQTQENITVVFDSIVWKDATISHDGVLDIFLFQRTTGNDGLSFAMQLGFYTPVSQVPAGTYPVNSTEDNYTFSASMGRYDNVVIPCFLAIKDDNNWVHQIWYITDGAITLGYDAQGQVTLQGTCTSYFGSTIQFTFGSQGTGWRNVQSADRPVKLMRDGKVFIRNGNRMYNIQGERVY